MHRPDATTMRPAVSLATRAGELALPAFLPDQTRGAVRCVDAADLERVGVRALMVNAMHVSRKPGVRTVKELGGLHTFMGWSAPIVTDRISGSELGRLTGAPPSPLDASARWCHAARVPRDRPERDSDDPGASRQRWRRVTSGIRTFRHPPRGPCGR